MNVKNKFGIAAVASVSAMTTLGGCAPSGTGTNSSVGAAAVLSHVSKPIENGSITVDLTQAVPDLDPTVAYDTVSAEIWQQIYEPLVTYKGSTDNLVGDLAKSWTVSRDGKTYTFHIRKGVKFSNGDSLVAKDFVFQLERILDKNLQPKPSPGSQFFLNITGAQSFYNGKAKTISGVSTPDDHTLVIRLDKPQQFFIKILAMPFLSGVDPKFVRSVGNAALDTTKAMGTGPFELKDNSQTQVVLVKNPHYWQKDGSGRQLPYLSQVTFNINNNSQLDALHWEQGQTAFMSPWTIGGDGIPSAAYPMIMDSPQYKSKVMQRPMNSLYYIGLNTKKTIDGKQNPLYKIQVRQAIEYAFDRNQYVKLENGADDAVNQPLPSTLEGYVPHLSQSAQYRLNLAKARQLLKQAGYSKGFTLNFWNLTSDLSKKEDVAFQSMMKQVGITVNIHEVSWKDYLTKQMSGDAQIFYSGWNQDFPDASDFLNTLFNSNQIPQNNGVNYSNREVDSWLNKAQFDASSAERDQLYAKVVNKVMSDAVWVPTTQTVGHWSVQSWVHGFYTSNVTYDPLAYIWVDPNHSH